jgi:hypothetical protein
MASLRQLHQTKSASEKGLLCDEPHSTPQQGKDAFFLHFLFFHATFPPLFEIERYLCKLLFPYFSRMPPHMHSFHE